MLRCQICAAAYSVITLSLHTMCSTRPTVSENTINDFPKKWPHFYFLNHSARNQPIWITFGTKNPEEIYISYSEPVHHIWKMPPLYLGKCKKMQLNMLWAHEITFISSSAKKCPLQLPCKLSTSRRYGNFNNLCEECSTLIAHKYSQSR